MSTQKNLYTKSIFKDVVEPIVSKVYFQWEAKFENN